MLQRIHPRLCDILVIGQIIIRVEDEAGMEILHFDTFRTAEFKLSPVPAYAFVALDLSQLLVFDIICRI